MDHLARSGRNSFTASPLDRATARRRDEAWLSARQEGGRARYLPLWRLQSLFAGEPPQPVLLPPQVLRERVPASASTTLLGVHGSRTFFAVELAPDREPPPGLTEMGVFRLPPPVSVSYRLIEDWLDEGAPG